jgi:hypothetical protein
MRSIFCTSAPSRSVLAFFSVVTVLACKSGNGRSLGAVTGHATGGLGAAAVGGSGDYDGAVVQADAGDAGGVHDAGASGSQGSARQDADAGADDSTRAADLQARAVAGSSGKSGAAGAAAVSVTLVNPAPGSKLFLGVNFWNVEWEGASDYFADGVNWATTKNPWNPQFLKDLAPYYVLRFMDWNLTNESVNPQASWDTRKQQNQDQSTEPVALEWQIDLCNRVKKDCWVNVSHLASADYVSKLATLFHDKLDPSLRVYVEWSNEVWNGGFPQRMYAQTQGQTLGLSGNDMAFSYQVYQSVRVFESFDSVFGKNSARVVKVISGQAANRGVCDAHLAALADAKINPKGTQPTAYAVAPYFRGATVDALMTTGIPEATGWINDTYACTNPAKLPLIAYEGGQDSYVATGSESGCAQVQMTAGMHDAYVTFLNAMLAAKMLGPMMQYTHSGDCWGLKQKTQDSAANSPKYQGVLDWVSSH